MINLFIAATKETWESNPTIFYKDRALTEYIQPEFKAKYGTFSPEAIAAIKKMPCLFACEDYERQDVYIGYITDISIRSNNIKIKYKLTGDRIEYSVFESMEELLDMCTWEYSRTHWTIKDVELAEIEPFFAKSDQKKDRKTASETDELLKATSLIIDRDAYPMPDIEVSREEAELLLRAADLKVEVPDHMSLDFDASKRFTAAIDQNPFGIFTKSYSLPEIEPLDLDLDSLRQAASIRIDAKDFDLALTRGTLSPALDYTPIDTSIIEREVLEFQMKKAERMRPKEEKKPVVFVSYCWSPADNKKKVIELIERLRNEDIIVRYDEDELHPGQDMNYFMESILSDTTIDHVLVVCNDEYAKRANARTSGAGYESGLILSEIRDDPKQTKYIPIILDGNADMKKCLPNFLKNRYCLNISNGDGFQRLLEAIRRRPI